MAATVNKSDIDSYYTRLNNVRSKFGLGQVSGPTITQNVSPVKSEEIKTFDQAMADTATQRASYISKDLPTGNLDPGYPTLEQTDVNIKSMLTTWEAACYHRSDHTDYSDRDTYSDYSDDEDHNQNDKYENERTADENYRQVCASVWEYNTDT